MPSSVFQWWCSNCLQSDRGRLSLENLCHDIYFGRLGKKIVRRLIVQISRAWEVYETDWRTGAPQAEKALDVVTEGNPSKFVLKARRRARPVNRYSHVMNGLALLDRRIDHDKMGWSVSRNNTATRVHELEKCKDLQNVVRLKGTSLEFPIGGVRKQIVWLAVADEIDELRANMTSATLLSKRLRDSLGLYHYNKDEYLVELLLSSNSINRHKLHGPTVLDAGTALVYRSHRSPDGWGKTVNLETKDDGLREAVHPSIKDLSGAQVRDIGQLKEVDWHFQWHEFSSLTPTILKTDGGSYREQLKMEILKKGVEGIITAGAK